MLHINYFLVNIYENLGVCVAYICLYGVNLLLYAIRKNKKTRLNIRAETKKCHV